MLRNKKHWSRARLPYRIGIIPPNQIGDSEFNARHIQIATELTQEE
jgi:hypothetical protein